MGGEEVLPLFSKYLSGDYGYCIKNRLPQESIKTQKHLVGQHPPKKPSTSLKGWLGSQVTKPAELSSSQEQGLVFTHSKSALVVTATLPRTVPSSPLWPQFRLCCSVMILMFLVTLMACCILLISLPIAPSSYHMFRSVQYYFTCLCGTQQPPLLQNTPEQRALSGQNRCYQAKH